MVTHTTHPQGSRDILNEAPSRSHRHSIRDTGIPYTVTDLKSTCLRYSSFEVFVVSMGRRWINGEQFNRREQKRVYHFESIFFKNTVVMFVF